MFQLFMLKNMKKKVYATVSSASIIGNMLNKYVNIHSLGIAWEYTCDWDMGSERLVFHYISAHQ